MIGRFLLSILLALLLTSSASATIIWVPDDYPQISQALYNSSDGDTIMVRPGTYNIIDVPGHDVVIMSEFGPDSTTIYGTSTSYAARFWNGSGPNTILEGFTVTNTHSAAIRIVGSSPIIRGNIVTGSPAGIAITGNSAPVIIENLITDNSGGTPSLSIENNCDVQIIDNVITDNTGNQGGAIRISTSDALIAGNIIANNQAGSGGGIYSVNSMLTVTNNLFLNNRETEPSGYGGGAIMSTNWPTVTTQMDISHCTFAGNSANGNGGAIYLYNEDLAEIMDCIFYQNSANNGPNMTAGLNTTIFMDYSLTEDSTGGMYQGSGGTCIMGNHMVFGDPLFTTGPQGDYYLSQLEAGQPAQSPGVDAGNPAGTTPHGTTRTDQMPDAGISDMGYHYPFPAVMVTMTPLNPPIVLPEEGGSFTFNIRLENTTDEAQTFDFWTEIWLPQFGTVPVLTVSGLTLPAEGSLTRNRTQIVPAYAPGGTYTYWGYIGDHPWVIDHAHHFHFDKEGSASKGSLGSPSDWPSFGMDFTEPNMMK